MRKTALVTGANRGIGLATVKKLKSMGYKVYMGVRSQEKANEALNKIGNPTDVIPLVMGLENEEQIAEAYKKYLSLKDEDESLDILINNAVTALDWIPDVSHISTLDIEYSAMEKMYRVNVLAPLFMMRYFLPSMKKGSRIVNVASGSGEFWDPNALKDFQPGYATTKSALIMLTKKMAASVINKEIFVNSCCPGWCKTETGGWHADTTPEDGADSVIATLFLNLEKPPFGHHYRYGNRIMLDVYPEFLRKNRQISLKNIIQKTIIIIKLKLTEYM